MNALIDTTLTEEIAHENFLHCYNMVLAKRYLMNVSEYDQYRNEALAKANSGNIHNITGMLGTLKASIQLAELYPDKVIKASELVIKCKSDIYKLLNYDQKNGLRKGQ